MEEVWKIYLPNKILAQSSPENIAAVRTIPLLRDRPLIDNKATAYVCERFTCKKPVTSAADLASQLLSGAAVIS